QRWFEMGDFDRELEAAARAARLSERRFGLEDARTLLHARNELAALSNVGRTLDAVNKRTSLLARQEALFGAQSASLAKVLLDLGTDEVTVGHLKEAAAHLQRARTLYESSGGLASQAAVALHLYTTTLLMTEGHFAAAASEAKEGIAIADRISILH